MENRLWLGCVEDNGLEKEAGRHKGQGDDEGGGGRAVVELGLSM